MKKQLVLAGFAAIAGLTLMSFQSESFLTPPPYVIQSPDNQYPELPTSGSHLLLTDTQRGYKYYYTMNGDRVERVVKQNIRTGKSSIILLYKYEEHGCTIPSYIEILGCPDYIKVDSRHRYIVVSVYASDGMGTDTAHDFYQYNLATGRWRLLANGDDTYVEAKYLFQGDYIRIPERFGSDGMFEVEARSHGRFKICDFNGRFIRYSKPW